ncbi:MAG: M23 family metallopeptidase [Thermodesulfobacteriota bacterium]
MRGEKSRPKTGLWLGALLLSVLWALPGLAGAQALQIQAPAEVALGEPFTVRLEAAPGVSRVELQWLENSLRFPLQGESIGQVSRQCVLGSDVKHVQPGQYTLRATGRRAGKQVQTQQEMTIEPKSYPLQELSLPESQVDLSAAALERHKREKAAVQAVLEQSTPTRHWRLPLLRPVSQEVGSVYGLRRKINGQPRSPHRGVDFRAPGGTPVRSVAAGRVVLVGEHFFAGKSVYVDHGLGMVSMYFHLQDSTVEKGERVVRGAVVGRCGSTGRVTGAHLHFGLSLLGQLVDPLPLFAASAS